MVIPCNSNTASFSFPTAALSTTQYTAAGANAKFELIIALSNASCQKEA